MQQLSWRQPRLLASKWYLDTAVLDVPFVPSPFEIVEQMIALAKVKKNEFVYDLGCGDGRIVLEAARRGARAVGVDLDARKIRECRINAVKANLTDKAAFVNQDFFETDFGNADVITLYLLSFLNLKLRSRFIDELRPGARIVSHDFHMDTWPPDKIMAIGNHTLYLWIVPANFSGNWKWVFPHEQTSKAFIMNVKQKFQTTQAFFHVEGSGIRIRKLKISADRISADFQEFYPSGMKNIRIRGKLIGDKIIGQATINNEQEIEFLANRDPETMKCIDC